MTANEAITRIRAELVAKYPGWGNFTPKERRLLCAAYMCDTYNVHEIGNSNSGLWVDAFLDSAGLDPGNPWCASFLTFCSKVAGAWYPKSNPGAVLSWKREGTPISKPGRGDIVLKMYSAVTGHIGVCVDFDGTTINSIEGNTSSGIQGSQRDGGQTARRRRVGFFDQFRAG